jgi:O-antigen/teichoic acid export membrane protein
MTDGSGAHEGGTGAAVSLRGRLAALRSSDIGKAGGLAVAMIANNVVALGSTVVFARLLDDYGSLAALVSFYLILSVAGQALQVATARDAVLGQLGEGPVLAATLRSWTRSLLLLTAAVAVVSVALRAPIADAVGVDQEWAAAVGLPAGVLWLLLSLLRGGLQGTGDYRAVGISLVGEQGARLVLGAGLAAAGLGVTGAYLGTPLSLIAMAVYCELELRRVTSPAGDPLAVAGGRNAGSAGDPLAVAGGRNAGSAGDPLAVAGVRNTAFSASASASAAEPRPARRLRDHVAGATTPIAGLVIVALLQNVDIIAGKHRFSTDVASSYGATAVAAKVLVWVAMGAGFYLVPETSRRHAEGEDTRPVLVRSLAIVLICALPVLAIFAFGGRQLLKAAFGADRLLAVDALLPLGVAFTLLALTYLAIQYLLALRRTAFLLPLGAIALAEPVLLLTVAPSNPDGFAAVVLAVQALAALVALGLAFARGRPADR